MALLALAPVVVLALGVTLRLALTAVRLVVAVGRPLAVALRVGALVRLRPSLTPNIAMPAIPSSNTQNFQHPIIGSLPIRQWILKLVSRLLILI